MNDVIQDIINNLPVKTLNVKNTSEDLKQKTVDNSINTFDYIHNNPQRRKYFPCCGLFFNKLYNIADFAIKSIAKRIQGFCAYRLALFHPVKCVCRKALLIY